MQKTLHKKEMPKALESKSPARRPNFIKRAGLAAALMVATLLPFKARADEGQPAPSRPQATQIRPYPNFSGGGVHGNPAIWPQYGNWGYLEFGRGNDGKNLAWLILSSRLAGDIHGLVQLNTALDSEAQTGGVTTALAFPLFAGFYLGGSTGLDSDGNISGQVGIAHVLTRRRLLVRSGIDYDQNTDVVRVGSEARFLLGPLELTGSGNVRLFVGDNKDSDLRSESRSGYRGQTLGAQARYASHLVSFGTGGTEVSDWQDFHLHYRLFATDLTLIDFHLVGRGTDLFKDPNYVGVGVTRLW